jgi:DNA-binding response OmpR family regulator
MKILIIEDEKELGKMIAKYLAGEDYICEFAYDLQSLYRKIIPTFMIVFY